MGGLIPRDQLAEYRKWISQRLRRYTPAEVPSLETFNAIVARSGAASGPRGKKETRECAAQPSASSSRPHQKSTGSGRRGRTAAAPEPSASVGETPQHPQATAAAATGEFGYQADPGPCELPGLTIEPPPFSPHLLQHQVAGQAVSGDTQAAEWPRIVSGSDHIFREQALPTFEGSFDSFFMANLSPDIYLPYQQEQSHTMQPPYVAETLELWRFGGPTRALKLPAKRSPSLEFTSVPAHMLTDMGFGLMSTDLGRQFVPLPPGDNNNSNNNNILCSEAASPATYFVHNLLVFPVEGGLPIEIDALVYPFRSQFDADWHHPYINMGSQLIKLLEEYPRLSISGDAEP